MIFEQRSEGCGRNQLSEKVGKRISGIEKIKSEGPRARKSLLIQGFQRRPKGYGAVGQRYVREASGQKELDFSPKAKEST